MATKTIVKGRLSYVHLMEPAAPVEGQDPVYSVSLIIKKDQTDEINRIREAIKEVYAEQGDRLKGNGKSIPALKDIRIPLRDGDEAKPDDPDYADSYFISLKSKDKPGIVDRNCRRITDPEKVYSGCYGRVSMSLFCYCVNGSRGISASLNNVQITGDGERLGGKPTAEEDFGSPAVDEGADFLS